MAEFVFKDAKFPSGLNMLYSSFSSCIVKLNSFDSVFSFVRLTPFATFKLTILSSSYSSISPKDN